MKEPIPDQLLNWRVRTPVAIVVSLVLHLLIVNAVPSGSAAGDEVAARYVELVEVPPQHRTKIETSPREAVREELPEPPKLASRYQAKEPRARSIEQKSSPIVPEPRSELPEPPLREPFTLTPLPILPTPAETARREVLRNELPPSSDEQRVTLRVEGMLKGALPPRTNDGSPMPELHQDEQGNLVHEEGAFVAVIAPDGSVTFSRNRGFSVDGLDNESPDPNEREIVDLHTRVPGVPLIVRRASEHDCAMGRCEDKGGFGITIRPHSDLNDAILRAKGEDPLAAKKRRFLRLTEELRDELSRAHRARSLEVTKLRASRHLERLWGQETLSFAEKRRQIFELWDECEEPRGSGDRRREARAGLQARRFIIRFIGKHLPEGSAEGYNAHELRRLNAKRASAELFEPYR